MLKYEIFPTMITPYRVDGSIDEEAVEKYVEWYYQRGCTGVFAICQSSEIAYLSLAERVRINEIVWNKAKTLEKVYGRPFTVVSSGHVAESIEAQAEELCAVAASGTDALILITNRLDPQNKGDDIWIANAEALLQRLPSDLPLGLYECPKPYKRLVTPKILRWCLSTGRFRYMKDTCCDAAMIAERCTLLQGSGFMLLNANCQTLLDSLRAGAGGYCGIMANFHPELYVWLCQNYKKEPALAELTQALLGTIGFTEAGTPYPLTAKYHMTLEGIPTEPIARNREGTELTDYMKSATAQMRHLCRSFYAEKIERREASSI